MITRDLRMPDGRTVRAHDSGGDGCVATVVWHHGTPQTGALYEPLLGMAAQRRLRLVSCARPGYGGSTPHPGRTVAAAASDAVRVADALGIDRFAVLGSSSGGSHALACAAVAPARVTAVACFAAVAPYSGGDEWFAGMVSAGGLRAALAGRAARARHAEQDEFDPAIFTDADFAALDGAWAGMGEDAGAAGRDGVDGPVDDDIALVTPWGCDLAAVTAPVLLVQGGQDRVVPPVHADLIAAALPDVERWDRPGDGHISVLEACPSALDRLVAVGRP
ncbi:alpha/beta fold hydrolase [Pseudonocardia sichuanensis]